MKTILILILFSSVCWAEDSIYVSSDVYKSFTYESIAFETLKPAYNMVFSDEKGDVVGEIDFSSGSVKFKGNIKKSARIFYQYFWSYYMKDFCK